MEAIAYRAIIVMLGIIILFVAYLILIGKAREFFSGMYEGLIELCKEATVGLGLIIAIIAIGAVVIVIVFYILKWVISG
jgi:hypothetical protein